MVLRGKNRGGSSKSGTNRFRRGYYKPRIPKQVPSVPTKVIEYKWSDAAGSIVKIVPSGEGQIYQINEIAALAGIDSGRITSSTIFKHVSLKLQVYRDDASADNVCQYFLYWFIVEDRAPEGAKPTVADIFPVDYFKSTPSCWNVKREESRRFIVKRSGHCAFENNAQSTTIAYRRMVVVNKFLKNLNVVTRWRGDQIKGGVDCIKSGALYIVFQTTGRTFKDSVGAQISGAIRVYYNDK